jgi:SAM-dependent methyltransferase
MQPLELCYETRSNLCTPCLMCPIGAELIWTSPVYKFIFPYETADYDERTFKEILIDVTNSAPTFDSTRNTMGRVLDEVLKLFSRKLNILDFGAGKLRNTLYLLEKGYNVCAVEFEKIQSTPKAKESYEKAKSFGKQFQKLVFPHEFFESKLKFDLILLINVCSIMPVPSERLLVLQYCREKLRDDGLVLWYTLHKDAARCVDEVKIGDGYYMHKTNRYKTFYRDFENHEIDRMFLTTGLRFKQLFYVQHNQARLYAKAGYNPTKEILTAEKIRQYVKGDTRLEEPKDTDIKIWYDHESPSINVPNPEELSDEAIYIEALQKTPSGKKYATAYHNLMAAILIKLFMPPLTNPRIEQQIDSQLKRIDLVMTNPSNSGFFGSLGNRFDVRAPYILIECKNYGTEVANVDSNQSEECLEY